MLQDHVKARKRMILDRFGTMLLYFCWIAWTFFLDLGRGVADFGIPFLTTIKNYQ